MDKLIERAFELTGAILIANDLRQFRDPNDVGYEVGIEQPGRHVRFANFFRDGEKLMMYFKHDASEIAGLYCRFPEVVLPSEVMAKSWSKMWVKKEPTVAEDLLKRSYVLARAALGKKGRQAIERGEAQLNQFLRFHQASLCVARQGGVYLQYSQRDEPCLLVDIKPVARFCSNHLSVRVSQDSDEDWQVLPPGSHEDWPNAIMTAVEQERKKHAVG